MQLSGVAAALGIVGKEFQKIEVNAIRRGATYWRTLTAAGIRSKGVGRAIWAKNSKSLRPIIKRKPVRAIGDGGYTGGLVLKGLASLQEVGGSTAPHLIVPKVEAVARRLNKKGIRLSNEGASTFSADLVFKGRNGWVRKAFVNHPGSKIPALPSAAVAVREVELRLGQEVEKGLQAAVAKAGLR